MLPPNETALRSRSSSTGMEVATVSPAFAVSADLHGSIRRRTPSDLLELPVRARWSVVTAGGAVGSDGSRTVPTP